MCVVYVCVFVVLYVCVVCVMCICVFVALYVCILCMCVVCMCICGIICVCDVSVVCVWCVYVHLWYYMYGVCVVLCVLENEPRALWILVESNTPET